MANEQNLKPFTSDQNREEAAKNGRKGGVASGKARREKADLKKMAQLWFESDVAKDKNGAPLTGAEFMIQVAAKEMKNGSARHWELLRDTAGFKPVDKIMLAEVEQSVIDEVEKAVLEDDETTGD